MTDLLGLGAAGVRAYQAALVVTGDNVANADSAGYVRRTIALEARPGAAGTPTSRDNSGGAGVVAAPVGRATDALKLTAARGASGDHARVAVRGDWLERLQTLVQSSDLEARIAGAFDAGTDLAAAPTSLAARQIFIDRLDQAATGFSGLGSQLGRLASDLDGALALTADELNDATAALARVNEELRRTQSGSSAANGLLDSRDRLLAEIADRVKISVSEGPRGTVAVRLGSGAGARLLVPTFGSAVPVAARAGPSGAELVLDPTHSAEAVRLPASGRLAGLLEAAARLAAMRSDIDALADRFATSVNDWHAAGADALGDPGTPLFATQTLLLSDGAANAGTAGIDFEIADGATLAPGGYRLLREPGGWSLARSDGSASVTGTGPLSLDGVTVRPGAGAATGDSWTLLPAGGAIGLSLRPVAAERLALADRYLVDADPRNAGGATLAVSIDAAAAAFAPAPPYAVRIAAGGIAEISDIATGTLLASAAVDGTPIAGAGFSITITGTPREGDSFRIDVTGAGSNDNGNIRRLDGVRRSAAGGSTLEAGLDAGIARLATGIAETRRLIDTASAVKDDTARAADAVSGVDLDREAAELTRLQAAYRANAQVIAAARALFDTLLQVAG